ncbi:MAG: hypothetical protein Q4Q07_06150 [Tissierellia bacterium]|nr:hypothetical protein [Tissierellia bacterium]
MKRICTLLLLIIMILPITTYGAEEKEAIYSPQNVKINGKEVPLKGYNIEGNNYYRLRDVAKYFKDTMCAFEVGYQENTKTIILRVPLGRKPVLKDTPMIKKTDGIGYPSKSKLQVEIQDILVYDLAKGKPKAYVIEDYTFFRLRDLAEFLLFDIGYDQKTNTVLIGTEETF